MKQLKTINLTTKILVALVVGIFAHLDSLVYGFGVLWADGYKYKVVCSSRFFGYRCDGL